MVLISDDISGFQPAGTRRTGLGTLLSDVFNQAAATVATAAPPPRSTVAPPGAESDGQGHWWNSDTQSWYNDSGGAYDPSQSAPPLQDALAQLPQETNYAPPSTPTPGQYPYGPEPAAPPSSSYVLNYGANNAAPTGAYSLDMSKYAPIQQIPDYANRIGPSYQPPVRPTAPTAPDPRIAQSFSGLLDQNNASYLTPERATDLLGQDDNAWDFTKQAIGDVAGPIGKVLTPITKTYGYAGEGGKALAGMAGSAATGDLVGPTEGRNAYNATTEDWNPLAKALADTAVNPVNYLGPAAGKLLVKGSGILPTIGRNLVDQGGIKMALGATVGSYGGQKLAEKAGAGQGVQQAASLIGGLTGGIGALAGPKIAKTGVRVADRTAVSASNRFMEPAGGFGAQADVSPMVFDKGSIKGQAPRTVIPDSQGVPGYHIQADGPDAFSIVSKDGTKVGQINRDAENYYWRGPTGRGWYTPQEAFRDSFNAYDVAPAPLANERLWFTSTRDMKYDLPDPEFGVGSQTGVSQLPGIYMAADPAKSAGAYGQRTHVSEFDGHAINLLAPFDENAPIGRGGQTWQTVRDDIAARLDAAGKDSTGVRNALTPESRVRAAATKRAEMMTPDNNYAPMWSLIDAADVQLADGVRGGTKILGKFDKIATSGQPQSMGKGVVADALSNNGVDGAFHHSPRADGDVLIVLNGQAARVVADVKNAPEAVKAGATLKDIKRMAARKMLRNVADFKSATEGITWRTAEDGSVLGDMAGNPARVVIRKVPVSGVPDGVFQAWIDGRSRGQWETLREAQRGAAGYTTGKFGTGDGATSIRTFRNIGDNPPGTIGGGADTPINAGIEDASGGDFYGLIQRASENPELASSLSDVMRRHGVASVDDLVARAMESTPEGIALQKDIMAAAEPHMPPPPSSPPAGTFRSPESADAWGQLHNAIREEVRLRRSGTIEAEKAVGRVGQATRLGDALNNAEGANISDATGAAFGALKTDTGHIRQSFAPPLVVSDAVQQTLVRDITDFALGNGKTFDGARALRAVDKLIKGEGLEPAEIKLLGKVAGDDFAKSVIEINQGRPKTTAVMSDADLAEIEQARKFREASIRKEEIKARNQHGLADKFEEEGRMNPTDPRYKKAAEEARAKAVTAENKANQIEIEQNRAAAAAIEKSNFNKEQKAATKENRADVKAAETADKLHPNDQMLLDKAKEMLGEKPFASESLNKTALNTIETWLRSNRQILDNIGDNTGAVAATLSRIAGDLGDSYTTHLVLQGQYIEKALIDSGVDEVFARKIRDVLLEREIQLRYPDQTPKSIVAQQRQNAINRATKKGYPREQAIELADAEIAKRFPPNARAQEVLDSIREASRPPNAVLKGMAEESQEIKNFMFGPFDIGVFGQQVLKLVQSGAPNILAGVANRTLAKLHMGIDINPSQLPGKVQRQLDGLGGHVSTGAVDLTGMGGTSFVGRHTPLVGGLLDKWINLSTDIQFRHILGNLRDLHYEGSLALAKLAGEDIADAAVRQQVAAMSNSASSFWRSSMNANRAAAESAGMMSASMRRAQVAQIAQLAKTFTPAASSVERKLAALTILSLTGTTLAIGKVLNDYIGVGDFEFDISKPGFGQITIPREGKNLVVSFFPQEQVVVAIAKSLRELAENPDTEGLKAVGEQFVKLGLSSSSPALQIFEKSVGLGYEPGQGYKLGDFNEGKGFTERALDALPLPPLARSMIDDGVDKLGTTFTATGFGAFDESGWVAYNRKVKSEFGDDYSKLGGSAKIAAEAKFGPPPAGDSKEQVALADIKKERLGAESDADSRLAATGDPLTFRDKFADAQMIAAAKTEEADKTLKIFGKTPDDPFAKDGWPSDPNAKALAQYFAVMRMRDEYNDPAYDAQEVALQKLETTVWTATQKAWVDDRKPADHSPMGEVFTEDRKLIGDSGYWDLRDKLWASANAKAHAPGYVEGQGYYDWYGAQVKEQAAKMLAAGAPKVIADSKARTVVDKIVSKFNERYTAEALVPWAVANPEAAAAAVQWGYLDNSKVKAFLADREWKSTKNTKAMIAKGDTRGMYNLLNR